MKSSSFQGKAFSLNAQGRGKVVTEALVDLLQGKLLLTGDCGKEVVGSLSGHDLHLGEWVAFLGGS